MGKTFGNMELEVSYKFHLTDVIAKFKKIYNSSDDSNKTIEILSGDLVSHDEEFLNYDVFKTSLLLVSSRKGGINLYTVIERFSSRKVCAKILSYVSPEHFLEETKDVKETASLIGDLTYNLLTNPAEAISKGYYWMPFKDK